MWFSYCHGRVLALQYHRILRTISISLDLMYQTHIQLLYPLCVTYNHMKERFFRTVISLQSQKYSAVARIETE
jgi:hypothetical protein